MGISHGHLIDKVSPGSPAAAKGIQAGWKLLRIDNQAVTDIIEYKIVESDDDLRLLLKTDKGILRRIRIKKEPGQAIGLGFDPPTMDRMKQCGNKCIFCFIDQNPPDMRPGLYIKDDDYRLSFLYGNFITLNRLEEVDLERITKLQLSPLYVSVHATDPDLRKKIFGTDRAEKGLENLGKLVRAGIKIHAQVVLCPGFNTGNAALKTIKDLDQLGQNILSVALVPVGLTGFRSGLEKIKRFSIEEAADLVAQVTKLQNQFRKTRGSRFVFLADEFYHLAQSDYPDDSDYESYPQLENGVGLARQFLEELASVGEKTINKITQDLNITVATGFAAGNLLDQLISRFELNKHLHIAKIIVDNRYFGKAITVTGLLTGSDLLDALKGNELGDVVFISDCLLREDSEHFLDGTTLQDLRQKLSVPVYAVSGPKELIEKIGKLTDGPDMDRIEVQANE